MKEIIFTKRFCKGISEPRGASAAVRENARRTSRVLLSLRRDGKTSVLDGSTVQIEQTVFGPDDPGSPVIFWERTGNVSGRRIAVRALCFFGEFVAYLLIFTK